MYVHYLLECGKKNKDKFELNLKDGIIPKSKNYKFLGITFDESLNFKVRTEKMLKRARKRLNIIKIFSHRSWHLSHVIFKGIYSTYDLGFATTFHTVQGITVNNIILNFSHNLTHATVA